MMSYNIIFNEKNRLKCFQDVGKDISFRVIEKEAEAVRVHPVNFIREVRKRNESQISE